jgi:hypothetical protein
MAAVHSLPACLPTCHPACLPVGLPLWPTECKLFQQHGLRSTFYTDEDMLAHFPLKPWGGEDQGERPPAGPGSCCGLCGRTDADMHSSTPPGVSTDSFSEEHELVTVTYCCGQVQGTQLERLGCFQSSSSRQSCPSGLLTLQMRLVHYHQTDCCLRSQRKTHCSCSIRHGMHQAGACTACLASCFETSITLNMVADCGVLAYYLYLQFVVSLMFWHLESSHAIMVWICLLLCRAVLCFGVLCHYVQAVCYNSEQLWSNDRKH